MTKFKGIIPAIITPFTKDGKIYEKGIENEIKYLADSGIINIFICGSYGAFPIMTTEERKLVVEIAVTEACKYNINTIVQVGSSSTIIAIELAEHAEKIGADAISSVVPFYYSSTFYTVENFLSYFRDIINSVSIEVHCYNNPKTTGYNITPAILDQLIDVGVKGIKDGGGLDMGYMLNMMKVIDKKDVIYYPSSTSSLMTGFILGVESCTSGVSLSVPKLILSIYSDMKNKDIDRALETWKKVMEIRFLLNYFGSRAIASYDVLNSIGVDVGYCRSPWKNLDDYERNFLIRGMKKLGVC